MNSQPSSSSTKTRFATIIVVLTKDDLSNSLQQELLRLRDNTQDEWHVALSGGSLPGILAPVMQHLEPSWHVYLADERCVPQLHADSNMGALKGCLQGLPAERIHGVNESLLEDPAALARDYEQQLLQHLPAQQRLDLALLGLGPDGHTCSLFPDDYPSTQSEQSLVKAVLNSPKPPAHRITLTFKALSLTRHVIFVGAGASKAPVLQQLFVNAVQWTNDSHNNVRRGTVQLKDPSPFPCGAVSPQQELIYIVDQQAYPCE